MYVHIGQQTFLYFSTTEITPRLIMDAELNPQNHNRKKIVFKSNLSKGAISKLYNLLMTNSSGN